LDHHNEFYLDLPNRKLFVYSETKPHGTVELGSSLSRLIEAIGTSANPVRDVKLRNLVVEKTYATHMHPHEMPSGGEFVLFIGAKKG
jgi:hypothetical protein